LLKTAAIYTYYKKKRTTQLHFEMPLSHAQAYQMLTLLLN